jgi:hypothetical protein
LPSLGETDEPLPWLFLKHAAYVWRIIRHGLTDIPELRNVIPLESENMDHCDIRIARLQPDP